ncbi:hypothetical protein BYT27DRAFT_7088633 [Phlegmacium glaucopus]|nr:hypothetical protein BYT27DRAFT_7088633 [Phlegmacium glaucopus]
MGPRAKNPHPGVPDQKAKRRSPQEMKEIREKEALEKETTREQQKNNIKKVAQIEEELRREESERHTSNRSMVAPFQPNIYASAKSAEKPIVIDKNSAREPYNDSGSEGSQDEYRPPAYEVSQSEPSESEAAEDRDEEDGAPKRNKVSWKGKNKPNRHDINVARSTNTSHSTDAPGKHATSDSKRKATSTSNLEKSGKPTKKAKNNQAQVSGLLPGWDSAYKTLSNARNEMASPVDNDNSMVRYGGMVGDSEEDDLERIAAVISASGKSSKKKALPAMIKISAATSAPGPVTKKALRGGANKWNLNHLPGPERQVVQKTFTQVVVPLAKAMAGTMVPWSELSVVHVQSLIDKAFGENLHVVQRDDVWCGLISYRLNSWRNGFGTTAATAVRSYIQENEENFENDAMTLEASGCFQHPLIMYTLAHGHFADFDDVPNPETLDKSELPSGALILALQAVYHAFGSWRTGKYIKDASPKGFFSADIYGDGIRREADGNGKMKARTVHVNTASQYLPTLKALTMDHWVKIFNDVREILEQGKKRKRSKSISSRASSDAYDEAETHEYILLSDD